MLDRNKMLLSASAMAIALFSSSAFAQNSTTTTPGEASAGSMAQAPGEQAAVSPADVAGVGDIIVTAQRRSERLQDVPIAITAVSGADLARLHADNVSRLEFIAPGFT